MEVFAAFVAFRKRNGLKEIMFLRARDMYYLMFPGGIQLPGESITDTLHRELKHQAASVANIWQIGTISGHTADGRIQIMHLFSGDLQHDFLPSNRVERVEWMDKVRVQLHAGSLTTTTLDKTLPFLEAQGLW